MTTLTTCVQQIKKKYNPLKRQHLKYDCTVYKHNVVAKTFKIKKNVVIRFSTRTDFLIFVLKENLIEGYLDHLRPYISMYP